MGKLIAVAGATGNLGLRIVKALFKHGASVKALVRSTSDVDRIAALEKLGAEIVHIDYTNPTQMSKSLAGVHCVISALAGLEETIIIAQRRLVDASIKAGIKRFIPSDFSIDYINLDPGKNRNLDLRRTFSQHLEDLPISPTSIFNGAFMDMLTDQIPMILFKQNKVLYWGNADQSIDFTTMDNTAEFTACIALEEDSPRFLHIAGDEITPREMARVVGSVTKEKFKLFRPGGLSLLNLIIKVAKFFKPAKDDLYPAWQGMQYMRDMMEGRTKQTKYNNNRYPKIKWTSVKDLITAHLKSEETK